MVNVASATTASTDACAGLRSDEGSAPTPAVTAAATAAPESSNNSSTKGATQVSAACMRSWDSWVPSPSRTTHWAAWSWW